MTTKIVLENIADTSLATLTGPKVSSIVYVGDDTAAAVEGGQSITLLGSGFSAGASVLVSGTAATVVTVVSSTQITFTSPPQTAGTYVIYVINSDGGTAISIPGISYSGTPNWSTSAGSLATVYETASISNTVTATGDAPITYSLASGTLPTGSTLDSSTGLLSGTAPASAGSTTYTFTIQASDLQNQTTNRTFSVTVDADAVTWSSPADNTTYELSKDSAMANVVLSAASAAGKSITYTANSLPTGVSISGSNIAGTPTVTANTTSIITATAAVTNRTATRTLNWVVSVAADPYFNLTTLLLNGDGTNGATNNTFIDSSANALAITRYGNTSQGSFSPYAPTGWSNYFNGTGDYLVTSGAALDTGAGTSDFTMECWVYNNGYSGSQYGRGIFTFYPAAGYANNRIMFRLNNGGDQINIFLYISGTIHANITSTVLATPGAWTHVAYIRQSGTFKLYINGTIESSMTVTGVSASLNTFDKFDIGRNQDGSLPDFNGYISNFRYVKGTAVYTANFTPPTAALTAIANTALLTCQSNRIIDNSTNNFTLTVTDDVKTQAFSPFAPTVAYSAATHGGSAYFDGTGDYLVGPGNNAALLLGTGDFTFEGWFYQTATNTYPGVLEIGVHVANGILFIASNGSTITAYGPAGFMGTATAPPLNTWNHIAWVRSSGTFKIYVNGVGNAGTASASNFSDNTTLTLGGEGSRANAAYTYSGYMSGVRLVKGTAVYTANFTPPTAPLTAITNTSLLLNGTNAGIIDVSGRNDLETVADTKISTAVKKYGTGSMVFDGTGDYLFTRTNPALAFESGDFTIEFWINFSSTSGRQDIVWWVPDNDSLRGGISWQLSGAALCYYDAAAGAVINAAWSPTINTWYHIALTRSSTTSRLFIDGTSVGTYGTIRPYATSYRLYIGKDSAADSSYFTGYLDDFRVTRGYARYTTTFTPPAAAFNTR